MAQMWAKFDIRRDVFMVPFLARLQSDPLTHPVPITPIPPATISDAELRNASWNQQNIAMNTNAGLYKFAQAHGLGRPISGEWDYKSVWRLQAYENGIVACPIGLWDQAHVVTWLPS